MARTTTTGTGADWRFTSGQPDAINFPDSGITGSGQVPMMWITGGGITANSNPSGIGMDRILKGMTDIGLTVLQVNAPNMIGNPTSRQRFNDGLAWGRTNLGFSNKPPFVFGISNGWVCSIVYARYYPVCGVMGFLTPCDGRTPYYTNNPPTFRGIQEAAYGISFAGGDPLPDYGSPLHDADNSDYPDLRGMVQMHYSANDPIVVSGQMAYGQKPKVMAEMHNVGAYGHVGFLYDGTVPTDHADLDLVMDFVTRRLAAA